MDFSRKTKRSYPDPFFTLRYIYDVISLNNYRFGDFVDRIYSIELEINDTTDTDRSASCLDLHLEFDSYGRLRTKLRQRRLFQFSHCELSIYTKQHSSSTCIWSIYLSVDTIFQSLWFYQDFLDRGWLQTMKLLNFDLVVRYGISVSQITTHMFHLS